MPVLDARRREGSLPKLGTGGSQGGAIASALAQRLPPGPERTALEVRASASFDRFRALQPDRLRAMAGDPPADLARAFEFVRAFQQEGRTAEATRLYANIRKFHGGAPTFGSEAADHHARLAAGHLERLPQGPSRRCREPSVSPRSRLGRGGVDLALTFDPRSVIAMSERASQWRAQADLKSDRTLKVALLKEAAAWLAKAG